MWSKKITLDNMTVACASEREYASPQAAQNDNTDPGIMNPLARALEQYYPRILQTAWQYINTEEMNLIKKKSEEVRAKKVY